jgi:hypothetical protein
MQLSKNFYLSEFTKSELATRKGLDNTPDAFITRRLKDLCEKVLQPLRDKLNQPIIVNSGYRSPAVNKLVGGSDKSQHCLGQAADIEVPGMSNKALAEFIKLHLPYDQLILEFWDGLSPNSGWVHVSYKIESLRKQYLWAKLVNGKTVYEVMK